MPDGAEPLVSLREWLTAPDDELRRRYDRLYFPQNDPRYLRRNALVAAGNSGAEELADVVGAYADSDDEMLKSHADWAARRLNGQ
jgi:epoxyqueuosine reductase QueG